MGLFNKKSPLISAVLPKLCIACTKRVDEEQAFCSNCSPFRKRVSQPTCKACGMSKKRCPTQRKSMDYDFVCAPFYYRGAIREGLKRFKFEGRRNSADYFASEMVSFLKSEHPDAEFDYITFVPMTKTQLDQRGFNQSQLLAEKVAKLLNIECRNDILVKLYDIEPQHNLSAMYRQGNVAGVFDVENKDIVRGKNILIIDDIKTTGYTLNECSKMLRQYDADMVGCVCAAIVI